MEITEHEFIQRYAEKCGHCTRNTLLPHEYEFTCFSCGYNVSNASMNSVKYNVKKTNFISRLKNAELQKLCICVDVYKNYKDIDYNKTYDVLSTLKNKKLKISNIINEKYKDMLEKPDFERKLLV